MLLCSTSANCIISMFLCSLYRDFHSILPLVIGFSNTYGLCFSVFLLGPGLVELPVRFNLLVGLITNSLWKRRNVRTRLDDLYKTYVCIDFYSTLCSPFIL